MTYTLNSLLTDESENYLRWLFQQSPITMSYPMKLELALLRDPVEVNIKAQYVFRPTHFVVKRNPATGNSALHLVCSTEDSELLSRVESLDRLNPDHPIHLVVSHSLFEIPRYKRAFLNSKENFFQSEKVLLKAEGEFLEELNLMNTNIDAWPTSF